MSLKEVAGSWFRALFELSRRERQGLGVLLLLFAALQVLPDAVNARRIRRWNDWMENAGLAERAWIDSMILEYQHPRRLFEFDPNTLEEAGWLELGVPASVVSRLKRYLAAGGHFAEPPDLLKVYDFPEEDYERLKPWIRIVAGQQKVTRGSLRSNYASGKPAQDRKPEGRRSARSQSAPPKRALGTSALNINRASREDFEALFGIGPVLASRTIKFRDKLGGFVRPEQLGEVYGLDSLLFRRLLPDLICEGGVRKLSVNRSPEDSLRSHPYIAPWQAEDIVQGRGSVGYGNLEQLLAIRSINQIWLDKLRPYLQL